MPHADAASLPAEIQTKAQFWDHVFTQVENLLDGQRTWVSFLFDYVESIE
jgi:L-methionine (R)-S-oxide reductase